MYIGRNEMQADSVSARSSLGPRQGTRQRQLDRRGKPQPISQVGSMAPSKGTLSNKGLGLYTVLSMPIIDGYFMDVCYIGELPLNWGSHFEAVLIIRALLFGVYVRAPDFRKLPDREAIWATINVVDGKAIL